MAEATLQEVHSESKKKIQDAISVLNQEIETATKEGLSINLSVTDSISGKHLIIKSTFSIKI